MSLQRIAMTVNGVECTVEVHPMERLLDVLRERLGLTGTKEGCGEGECGACSVLMDGTLVNSCLVPVAQAANTQIVTIEGLGSPKKLDPVQEAFLQCGGSQCGMCTPGMIMAAKFLLMQNPRPTCEEIREGLGGNLCRCTGYMRIFEAVEVAAKAQEREAAQ
ncbi:MAG TPA: (2Fe-2S)-binding protein [Acidobacteriaceae bacterium]|nr:(2Fe-2S)-binding protein [Acidobacteriaceae bacterium]